MANPLRGIVDSAVRIGTAIVGISIIQRGLEMITGGSDEGSSGSDSSSGGDSSSGESSSSSDSPPSDTSE